MHFFFIRKQIEISCALLQKLLSVLQPSYAFNKYSVSIERSIHHPNDTVKSTILSEVNIVNVILGIYCLFYVLLY
jgi:hypothetical protein